LEIFAVLLAALSVALVLGGFVVSFALKERERDDLAAAWRAYASARAMRFTEPAGEWPHRTMPEVDGGDGRPGFALSTSRAGGALRTRVCVRTRETVLAHLVASTDARDAADVGVPARRDVGADGSGFAAAYAVAATPEVFAERALSADVRRALVAFRTSGYVKLEHDRGEVSVVWDGAETNAARLDEATRLAEMIADTIVAAHFGRAA
jgi:hypothetical protein